MWDAWEQEKHPKTQMGHFYTTASSNSKGIQTPVTEFICSKFLFQCVLNYICGYVLENICFVLMAEKIKLSTTGHLFPAERFNKVLITCTFTFFRSSQFIYKRTRHVLWIKHQASWCIFFVCLLRRFALFGHCNELILPKGSVLCVVGRVFQRQGRLFIVVLPISAQMRNAWKTRAE